MISHVALVFYPGAAFGSQSPRSPGFEYAWHGLPILNIPLAGQAMVADFFVLSGVVLS